MAEYFVDDNRINNNKNGCNTLNYDRGYESLKIRAYYKEISKYATIEGVQRNLLEEQYERLSRRYEGSILKNYLEYRKIKKVNNLKGRMIFPFGFNLSQKEAVNKALENNVSVIEGPPGTGKTQTILNIIANLAIMQEKTVAVVSGSNSAVDNVFEKMQKNGYDFFIARLGSKERQEDFFNNINKEVDIEKFKINIDEIELYKRLDELNVKLDKALNIKNDIAKLKEKLMKYKVEQKHFNYYFEKQDIDKLEKIFLYNQTCDRMLNFIADIDIIEEKDRKINIIDKIKFLFKYGYTRFKKLENNEIEVILNLQSLFYVEKIKSLESELENLENELKKLDFNDGLSEYNIISTKLFKNKIYNIYNELSKDGFSKDNFRKEERVKFFKYFPVILSTTYSITYCLGREMLFDYVIVDESSLVDLTTAILTMSCAKNLIVVGDTKQLPAIINEDLKKKEEILKYNIPDEYDYFSNNLLTSIISVYKEQLPRTMLKEHYRCHPKIIGFCNSEYYNNELVIFTEESEDDVPLKVYKTAKGNHMTRYTNGDKIGVCNEREILVLKKEFFSDVKNYEKYLKNKKRKDGDKKEIKITKGFTCPYRLQAKEAEIVFLDEVKSDTIHKYQGREENIMMMSTVVSNNRDGVNSLQKFVDDPFKINVAVSRAKDMFVLVTDHDLLENNGKDLRNLLRYMMYNSLDEDIIESKIVSVFDLLYENYDEILEPLRKRIKHNTKYLSENIIFTILSEFLEKDEYKDLRLKSQVKLVNLVDLSKSNEANLNKIEIDFIKHNSSVDFVIYDKDGKNLKLVIEVDGFSTHSNNKEQLERDKIKNSILSKYGINIVRLNTKLGQTFDKSQMIDKSIVDESKIKEILDKVK